MSRAAVYVWKKDDRQEFQRRFEHAQHTHRDWLESILFDILKAMNPKKPVHPTYLALALNGAYPEKYRPNVAPDTSDVGKDVLAELRKRKKEEREHRSGGEPPEGGGDSPPGGDRATANAQDLVERIKARRTR